jgi:hypothetical protein
VIFPTGAVDMILAGKKREDWRPACNVKVGRSYVLQRGREATEQRITIVSLTEDVELGTMTLRQAKRAGFKTVNEAWEDWARRFGTWNSKQQAVIISFVLGDQTDKPRLLAARPGAPHGDYVTLGQRQLPGAGEAIPALLQAKYSGEARAARQALRDGALEQRTRRLVDLVRDTAAFTSDPRLLGSLRVAERGLLAVQRKIGA